MMRLSIILLCIFLTSCFKNTQKEPVEGNQASNLSQPVELQEKESDALSRILWVHRDVAVHVARKYDAPILLYIYSNEHKPSVEMDYNVFGDPDIASFLNNEFVCTRADAKFFNGDFLPATTIVLSPDGQIVATFVGHTSAKKFKPLLESALNALKIMQKVNKGEPSIKKL